MVKNGFTVKAILKEDIAVVREAILRRIGETRK